MLRQLSGRTHSVFTGLSLRHAAAGWRADEIVDSRVTFKALSEETITEYLARVHTLDKAGGYAIQEHGELIVASYTGSLTNIVGLPVDETRTLLTRAGLIR
jgi:septum formation protein